MLWESVDLVSEVVLLGCGEGGGVVVVYTVGVGVGEEVVIWLIVSVDSLLQVGPEPEEV